MSTINPISFSSNSQNTNNSRKNKNYGLFLLTYATMLAVFPHDVDKYVNKVDINFNQLPLKDKAKNVAKVAIPMLGYPLLVMLGLKAGVDFLKKHNNSKEKQPVKYII